MKYLAVQDILDIHNELVIFFEKDGDPIAPAGPRDIGLVESSAQRPKTGLGSQDKYTSVEAKAAALFHSLVKNHGFHNGNKSTALVSTARFLDLNERRLEAEDDELFEMVTAVADGHIPGSDTPKSTDEFVHQIENWFRTHTQPRHRNARSMKISEFLEAVESAGGGYRKAAKGGSWIVSGPNNRNIRISQSTSRMDGNAIRRIVSNLGLSEAQSGIAFDDFQDGIMDREDLIQRLLSVLRRLAHA
jgi:death-on-curing family protein